MLIRYLLDKILLDIAAEIALVRQKWHLNENFVFYINFNYVLIQQLNSDKRHFLISRRFFFLREDFRIQTPEKKSFNNIKIVLNVLNSLNFTI